MTTINPVGNGLTGITGSGNFVGATSPTIATPTISGAISVATAATSNSLVISTSNGYVTTPNHPAFLATSSGHSNVTGDGTTYQCVYETAATNISSSYNTSTGLFTAPVAGMYLFTAAIDSSGIVLATNTSTRGSFNKNNGTLYYFQLELASPQVSSGELIFNGSIVVPMALNDTMAVDFYVAGGTKVVSFGTSGYFSGVLVG